MREVKFFSFSAYHNKVPVTGSTHIRVNQLIKYWPEAGLYKYGDNPDVLIFQKVYCTPDYQFPKHFKGIKILDICDPDHLNGMTGLAEMVKAMDAITCPTEALAKFLGQMTDKPVVVVPDRYDLDEFPAPKQHTEDAKQVVWFGYRHNAETLKPAMDLINQLDLNLLVLSDDDPMPWQWLPRSVGERFKHRNYTYIKYDSQKVHEDIQLADFAVLPLGTRPVDRFKSNNRAVRAILCSLPVATVADEVRALIDAAKRREYMDRHYEKTREEYDIRRSVEQMKQLVKEVKNG